MKEQSNPMIRLQRGRFSERTNHINSLRKRVEYSIDSFKLWEDNRSADIVRNKVPDELEKSDLTLNIGSRFSGKDKYLWLSAETVLPPRKSGNELYGWFDFGNTYLGATSGFEGLLYINGTAYQGIDSNHMDVNLNLLAGQRVKLEIMLWTGFGSPVTCSHTFREASIGYINTVTDELYFLFRSGFEALDEIDEANPVLYSLTDVLEKTLALLDFNEDRFDATATEALSYIRQSFKELKLTDKSVSCIGHTHIDVAWLWRLKHTREKAIRSFTTVNRLMEEFNDYYFLQSQPQIYDYVKNDMPQLYSDIKKRIKDGRWEAEGGMWLEADCNLTSIESLIRQLSYGKKFIQNEFGHACEYLWIPDAFGFSWALPQILKMSGINTVVTTKISWNDYNTFPNDLFWWRGIDGSEILTYFICTPEKDADIEQRMGTYNGYINAFSVNGNWRRFKNKEATSETLLCYGYGDGGGGVSREMLKMCHAIQETPGLPNIRLEKAGEFLKRLHDKADSRKVQLPIWDGELYLENHRGTYTTQANNKKNNRRGEQVLRKTEWISALDSLYGGEYRSHNIDKAWKILLRNQFHDILPGSSVREVYLDCDREYSEMFGLLDEVCCNAQKDLIREDAKYITLYNYSDSSAVQGVLLNEPDISLIDLNGRILPSQTVGNNSVVQVKLPKHSIQSFCKTRCESVKSSFEINISDRTAVSPFYIIKWDKNGRLTSFVDLENSSREILAGEGNKLFACEDIPNWGDAWNIETSIRLKQYDVLLTRVQQGECGGLFCDVIFEYSYNKSIIHQKMRMYSFSRRIDFITQVDWRECGIQLNTAFEVDIRSTRASYEIQGGYIERPTHENTTWDSARFEVVGHSFSDLSEAGYGVALLNDCKYGYHTLGNSMGLTLLRSSKYPDKDADMGLHSFTYSLLPHTGSLTTSNVFEEAKALNYHIEAVEGLSEIRGSVLSYNGNMTVEAFKMADDKNGYILRIREELGGHTPVEICFLKQLQSYTECNLLEENIGKANNEPVIKDYLRPFQIKTYRLLF